MLPVIVKGAASAVKLYRARECGRTRNLKTCNRCICVDKKFLEFLLLFFLLLLSYNFDWWRRCWLSFEKFGCDVVLPYVTYEGWCCTGRRCRQVLSIFVFAEVMPQFLMFHGGKDSNSSLKLFKKNANKSLTSDAWFGSRTCQYIRCSTQPFC